MRTLSTAVLLSILSTAAAAAAGDLCMFDTDNEVFYRFVKLKEPKGPTTALPLAGVAEIDGVALPLPVSGTVTRQGDALVLGFTRYGVFCVVSGTLELESGDGVLSYDCNLDGVVDETVGIETVSCEAS
jgi:hypothetical protein